MTEDTSDSLRSRRILRALFLGVTACLLLLFPAVGADWWLWESPQDNAELPDQEQTSFNSYQSQQNGHGLGQSFIPRQDTLSRIDFMIKNRYDLRPFTLRLWKWVDTDGNGQADEAEYDATVAGAPLWQDSRSIPGQEDRVLVTFFPGLSVTPDVPYYLEFVHPSDDGEWGIYVAQDAVDPYPDGRLRLNDAFRSVPEFSSFIDMYFRTYPDPTGPAPPLECADTGQAAPCFSAPGSWELPDTAGPPPSAADYRFIVESNIEARRQVILSGNGKYAVQYAMYDAFLYRVTGDESYARNVVDLFEKATEWRQSNLGEKLHFGWGEHPGWAYQWVQASPSLTTADHRMIKTLLLHSGMLLWPGRDLGLNNHPLGRGLSYKQFTEAIPAAEFVTLSACDPGPPPACDGLFQDGQALDATDHAAWEAYAQQIWDEFKAEWDLEEDACRYDFYDLQFVMQIALLYGEYDLIWDDPGFRGLVDRLFDYFLPMGAFPIFGDTAGWSMAWGSPIWLFEEAAARWQEPRYKWLVHRLYDYRRTHLKPQRKDGANVELWQSVFEEYPAFCHAYFVVDPGVAPQQPAPQAEQLEARQDQQQSEGWPAGSAGLGQTFEATGGPLVRIDVLVDHEGDDRSVEVRLWEWIGDHAATVAQPPLYAADLDLFGATGMQQRTAYPFLDLLPGSTYYVEFSRATAFSMGGSASGGPDAYPDGGLWSAGNPVTDADLWFRSFSLNDQGSKITWRLGSTSRRVSQRGFPVRTHDLGGPVRDKLILRSGFDPQDLHAVVNLVSGEHFHGQLETGAVVSLAHAGSALLVDTAYFDRREKDHNSLQTRRYFGGTHGENPAPLSVGRFLDSRETTVAWIDWDDPQGFGVGHQRRFYFVKNRFLLVRDRATFPEALEASTGNVWHAYDVHPEHGAHWYSLYNREPIGQYGWLFRNPEQYLLLHMAPRPGYDFDEWEVLQTSNPPSPQYNVSQRWVGSANPADSRWFDSLLLPHGPALTPAAAAANVRILHDDGTSVAYKIDVGNETWTVVDNPQESLLVAAGLRTDALYLIARTSPDGTAYLLTESASDVEIDDGPGRLIRLAWPVETSVELVDVASVQDVDGDGIVDGQDTDDDGDGVDDLEDASSFDRFVCRDADLDGCEDCQSGSDDPADDGPDADLDGVCDLSDNCPDVANPDQADQDADGLGDPCDACPGGNGSGQPDLDQDGVSDLCDNCPLDPNPGQTDLDGDSVGDRCDLDDGLIVLRSPDIDGVSWDEESGWDAWNCYRGDLELLKVSGSYTQLPGSNPSADRHCGLNTPTVFDSARPAAGQAFFYLTTGLAASVEGGLGEDSSGSPRPNSAPCP